MRQRLIEATRNIELREVVTFLYRDHPQGETLDSLKPLLFLHESFDESRLQPLVDEKILAFDGKRYKITADARQVLDRDPTILLDEFLR